MTGKLLCIGHRGAMGHAPENTLASFAKALEMGVDCIELDVYVVGGQLVVFHDDNLERTTNGQGLLMDQSLTYLRSLDAGQGEIIPNLDEVFNLVQAKAGINIELKGPGTAKPVVQFVQGMINAGWDHSQILVSSFDRQQLQTCRMLDNKMMLGVLYGGPLGDHLEFAGEIGAFSLHPSLQFVDSPTVQAAHDQGLRVYVYTANDRAEINRMETLGIDGVFTNYPEIIKNEKNAPLNVNSQNDRITGFL